MSTTWLHISTDTHESSGKYIMGQAKRRGSFEDRRAEGEARHKAECEARQKALCDKEMSLTPEEREQRKTARRNARWLMAIAEGAGISLPQSPNCS